MTLRLLVAEDSKTMQRVLQIAFASTDATLRLAGSVAEAKTLAHREPFDALLLDAELPDGDGYALCQSLHTLCARAVPALLLTSQQHPFDPARASHAGIVGHVDKPFRTEELVAAVLHAVGRLPGAPSAAPSGSIVDPSAGAAVGGEAASGDGPYFDPANDGAARARSARPTQVRATSDVLMGRARFGHRGLFDEAAGPLAGGSLPPLPSWELPLEAAPAQTAAAASPANEPLADTPPPATPGGGVSAPFDGQAGATAPVAAMAQPADGPLPAALVYAAEQAGEAGAPSASLLAEVVGLLQAGPHAAATPALNAALTAALEQQLSAILWEVVPRIVAEEVRRYLHQGGIPAAQSPTPPPPNAPSP